MTDDHATATPLRSTPHRPDCGSDHAGRRRWWSNAARGLALLAVLGLGACALNAAPGTPALSEADRGFILEAARSGLYVADVARVAEQRSENAPLKAYAAQLVRDRSAADAELRQLAAARGLTLPDATPPEQRSVVDALKALPAGEFDQRFVQQVGLAGQQTDITLHQGIANRATDPELKGWATRMLAMLREHLAAAQRLPVTLQARL